MQTKNNIDIPMKRYTAVQKDFNQKLLNAKTARESGCFWDGGDWADRWSLQKQLAVIWFGNPDEEDGYQSNVKSPEIAGRIDSVMQRLARLNLKFVVRPKREEVKEFAKVYEEIINNAFDEGNIKYRLRDAFYNALVHGTAALTVDFIAREREVKMPVTNPEEMTAEEKKALKENGKIPYRTVRFMDKYGVSVVNRELVDIFVDPSARNIHDDVYYAGYYFRVTMMPYARFKQIYSKKVGFINIDKVKPLGRMKPEEIDAYVFFNPPSAEQEDYVYLVEMFDYDNDRYIVKANDVFITPDDNPLPYVHKQLNLVFLYPKKLPDQIYGIGLVDMLLPIVTELEMLQNAVYDYVLYTTNPVLLVEKHVYGDFSNKYREAKPGLMLPVDDIGRSVAPLKYPPLSMDIFQAMNNLKRDAVIASQLDPSQLGVVIKNATATANLINKEITDAFINYVLQNFMEALNQIAKQVFWLYHQFLTKGYVRQRYVNGKLRNEKVSVVIRTKGKKFDIDWEQLKLKDIKYDEKEDGYLELRPDIFFYKNTKGEKELLHPDDLDIMLSTESTEIVTKAIEAQKAREMLQLLSPFLVDPHDPEARAKQPMGWVDGPGLLREVFEKNGFDTKYLLNKKEVIEDAIKRAEEQNKKLIVGQWVMPRAGEPFSHIEKHTELLEALVNVRGRHEQEIEQLKNDPEVQQLTQVGQVHPRVAQIQGLMAELDKIINMLQQHILIDSQPAKDEPEVLPASTKPKQPNTHQGRGQIINPAINSEFMNSNQPMPGTPNMPRMGGASNGGPGMIGGLGSMVQ